MPHYIKDLVCTSTPYIDSKAYNSLADAITAIGSKQTTLLVTDDKTVSSDLTIPSNITLSVVRGHPVAIAADVTLTLQTTEINSPNCKIFTGDGSVVFASGTVVKHNWFGDLPSTVAGVGSAEVTLLVDSKDVSLNTDLTIPSNVVLRVEKGCPLTIGSKPSVSGESLGTGDGSTTSFSGTLADPPIKLGSLSVHYTIGGTAYTATSSIGGTISGTDCSGTIDQTSGSWSLTFTTAPDNGSSITADYTPVYQLTIGSFDGQGRLWQMFEGEGSVKFSAGAVSEVYPEWWGAKGDKVTDDSAAIASAVACAGVSSYHLPVRFQNRKYAYSTGIILPNWVDLRGSALARDCYGYSLQAKTTILYYTGSGNAIALGLSNKISELSLQGTSSADFGIYIPNQISGGDFLTGITVKGFTRSGGAGVCLSGNMCIFMHCAFSGNYNGLEVRRSNLSLFKACSFDHNTNYGVSGPTTGYGPIMLKIEDCLFQSNGASGLYLKRLSPGGVLVTSINGWFEANNSTVAGYQVHIEGYDSSSRVTGVVIENCYMNAAGASANGHIYLENTDGVSIRDITWADSSPRITTSGINTSLNIKGKCDGVPGEVIETYSPGGSQTTVRYLFGSYWSHPPITFAAGDTTPDVQDGDLFLANGTSPVTVTNFTFHGYGYPYIPAGHVITVIGTDDTNTLTLNNGGYFSLSAASIVLGLDDSITLYWNGSRWIEIALSLK